MHIKPVFTALITAGTLALTAGPSTYAEEASGDVSSSAHIVVRYERGRVDITATNAPFAAVVAKLSATLNIPMEIKGPSPGPVTLHLRDMAVESTLKSLSRNVIIIYDDSGKKLKKAILIAAGTGSSAAEGRATYNPPAPPIPPMPTSTPDPTPPADPSQSAQPEGWVEPPATEVAAPQTEAEEP